MTHTYGKTVTIKDDAESGTQPEHASTGTETYRGVDSLDFMAATSGRLVNQR